MRFVAKNRKGKTAKSQVAFSVVERNSTRLLTPSYPFFPSRRKNGSKHDRMLAGLQRAFAGARAYLPLGRQARLLDERELITGESILTVCKESG
jgi:hypothetical protein